MAYKIRQIVNAIERLAPLSLAEAWDNSGLQIGDMEWPVKKILLSLDVSQEVVKEAVRIGAGLIITHHPLIFPKLRTIDLNKTQGRIICDAIKGNISIYSAHTNLDKAKGGVNDQLALALGLKDVSTLLPEENNLYKLVVFVPKADVKAVKKAIGAVGAGLLGNYSHCSFSALGEGNFMPLIGAKPTIGIVGRLESVEEVKLEVLVRRGMLSATINAMLKSHPYEEVAYDIYALKNKDTFFGLGRIGALEERLAFSDFIGLCRKKLLSEPRWAGGVGTVKNVAVCGGAGADLIALAQERGADVLVTGDVKYHDAWLAKDLNFCVID